MTQTQIWPSIDKMLIEDIIMTSSFAELELLNSILNYIYYWYLICTGCPGVELRSRCSKFLRLSSLPVIIIDLVD